MHAVPDLPYAYGALGPYVSEEIMKLHHDKHHVGYVTKLNKALEVHAEYQDYSIERLCREVDALPEELSVQIRKQGGGHYNHSLFWRCMIPGGSDMPEELERAVSQKYGSKKAFLQAFADAAKGVFGSGWAWVLPNLEIVTTANQENPLMAGDEEPILALDVWEHAYYIDYQNDRATYIEQWLHVVDWQFVATRYAESK